MTGLYKNSPQVQVLKTPNVPGLITAVSRVEGLGEE